VGTRTNVAGRWAWAALCGLAVGTACGGEGATEDAGFLRPAGAPVLAAEPAAGPAAGAATGKPPATPKVAEPPHTEPVAPQTAAAKAPAKAEQEATTPRASSGAPAADASDL
jgi:hypothetical protein